MEPILKGYLQDIADEIAKIRKKIESGIINSRSQVADSVLIIEARLKDIKDWFV